MKHEQFHISEKDLLQAASGELSPSRASQVRDHLAVCWTCRTRSQEIENTITDIVRAYRDSADSHLPDAGGPRALLRARLAESGASPAAPSGLFFGRRFAYLGGALAVILAVLYFARVRPDFDQQLRLTPDPHLTPGATVLLSAEDVCAGQPSSEARVIPASVGRQVFSRYGIDRPRPLAYELDYLIAPELGGADDPRNFWPQPYGAPVWNAHVKDALEDHLHELVCRQQVSLETAQQEIAADWISAYKKYFQTEQPMASHIAFTKDQPWQP
jgi:hypothetical protein